MLALTMRVLLRLGRVTTVLLRMPPTTMLLGMAVWGRMMSTAASPGKGGPIVMTKGYVCMVRVITHNDANHSAMMTED